MSLSDPKYIGFLFAVFLLFYILRPGSPRRVLLLGASYFFYFELSHYYAAVLLFVTLVTWKGALLLRSREASGRGPLFFWLVCAVALSPLVIFKYLGPLTALLGGPLPVFAPVTAGLASLALPVGISFFTFAALGYLIDVYLDVLDPEPRLAYTALFLAFFPVISAGPIERAGRFMPQFDLDKSFSADRSLSALRTILTGLVLKVIFAGFLVVPVDSLYAAPAACTPLEQLCGIFIYPFYLYADFAGYSLIAIGSAKMFGLEVRPNFLQPFLSATVPEFWRNWHISLSSWVRDYLFSPLRMEWRNYKNRGMAAALLLSFVILGVWHGAKWGYFFFGVIHGLLVIGSTFTLAARNQFLARLRMPPPVVHAGRVIATFALVMLSFVPYRAETMHDALGIWRAIFSPALPREISGALRWFAFHHGAPPVFTALAGLTVCWAVIAAIIAGDILVRCKFTLEKLPVLIQAGLYNGALLIVISDWLTGHGNQPFVYFKF